MLPNFSRIAFTLLLTSLLAACAQTETPVPDNDNQRPLAAEGEFCGGIAGILCADGLICDYDGNYPDAGGTCIPE